MGHLKFIDGLRAVSILAVVAYHVHVPYFTGGFVGVDVFFVISGALIINQIVTGLETQRFSFVDFYAKRSLRILPSYLLVIAACCAVAPFILVLPNEYIDFGHQVAASALMVANHFFLNQQGYFNTAAETKPLLNLWSLSVEEQFYLVTPFLLAALWWLRGRLQGGRRLVVPVAALVLGGASFWLCVAYTGGQAGKNYSFFLTPMRGWEFLLGGVAMYLGRRAGRMHWAGLELMAVVGLAAIGYSIFALSVETPFPSFYAAIPAIGASLVICSGLARNNSLVARLLSLNVMSGIGLVSYSWYLWHWPVLTFVRTYNFDTPDIFRDSVAALVALGLSVLTYLLLERPIASWRKGRVFSWRPIGFGLSGALSVALGGVVLSSAVAPGIARQFSQDQMPELHGTPVGCSLLLADISDCMKGRKDGGILIGDSHAMSVGPVFGEASGGTLNSWATGGCIALLNVKVFNPDPEMGGRCRVGRENGLRSLREHAIKPKYAILFSSWNIYTRDNYPLGGWSADKPSDDQRAVFLKGVKNTIHQLRSFGVERILIIAPVPEFRHLAPQCIIRSDHYGVDRDVRCSVSRASVEERRAKAMQWLGEGIAGAQDVRVIDPINDFCDGAMCRPYLGDTVLYFDTNHVSDAGARRIYQAHQPAFRWAFGLATS